jgi:hypothetical protein
VVRETVAVYDGPDDTSLLQPLRTAQPGEWYRVERTQLGFALATPEGESTPPVWFRIDPAPLGLDGVRICP